MYNGGQWSGFGKEESTELFRELVENTPQIPVDRMVYQIKLMKKRVTKYLSHLTEKRKVASTVVCDDPRETAY